MKKSVYIILIVQLLLGACAKDEGFDTFNESNSFEEFLDEWGLFSFYADNPCTNVTDALEYPAPWTAEVANTFVIPGETINEMSTCGLLVTLLEHPTIRVLGPFCFLCSDLTLPGITMFNDALRRNKAAAELFKRSDCFPVLAAKYLSIIQDAHQDIPFQYFELLLSSDLCMEALNENEKIMLMVMALEKKKYENPFSPYIMISIMRSCNYEPFIQNVTLYEHTRGYMLDDPNDGKPGIKTFGLKPEPIIKYAKQFLKNYKTR